jgi:hypothetical protein
MGENWSDDKVWGKIIKRDWKIKLFKTLYSDYNLETTGKPDTDYIIKSATKYVLVKNLDDVEKAIGLLQIASG